MTQADTPDRLSLAVVFLISRRCNLECTYCNVDAGPQARRSLDPRRFEAWVRALAEFGDLDLGIQLHGGEPLLLDPSVELLASIARNAVIPCPTSSIGTMGIVTNGVLLDAARAESLVEAGLHVALSVDGPRQVHDRHRVTRSGRGSHAEAMRGLAALRSVDPDPLVIAVVSEPADVGLAVRFFAAEGLSRVKINPVRPEARGATIRGDAGTAQMEALADAYFEAAVMLAAHNRRRPHQRLYEENIATLTAMAAGGALPTHAADWTLLVDDRGRLWSHPGGYGVEHMALTTVGSPSAKLLARALGIAGAGRSERMLSRRRTTFRPCAGCADPIWCARFRPPVGGPAASPDCAWRERLTSRLEAWWKESPLDALAVVPFAFGSTDTSPPGRGDAPPSNATGGTGSGLDEPLEPAVRVLLAGMCVGPDGRAYLADYAERATEIQRLDPSSNERTFLQLATLARAYAGRDDRLAVAQSLARLARPGLERLARRRARRRGPAPVGSASRAPSGRN